VEGIRTDYAPIPHNTTRELAEFVVGTSFGDLPTELVDVARRCTLDCLGVSVGAAEHPSLPILLRVLSTLGGEPQATVWGTDRRMSLAHAAFVNGHLGHILDFDDTLLSEATTLHATATVIPAALAVGEWRKASGAEYVLAFLLGYEVAARIALSAGRTHHRQRWAVMSTVGPFGAATAAGKLLGLNERQLVYALGIAGSQAAGLLEGLGSMTNGFRSGHAASVGLLAALLAEAGFTSAEDILTGKHGFHATFHSDRDIQALVGELGTRWVTRSVGFKPFACGINLHALLAAVIALREKHSLQAANVELIEARVNPHVLVPTGKKEPRTGLEGKYSVYHSAAVALIDGAAGPPQYTDARVTDPEVVALRGRVRVTPDDSVRRDEAFVMIKLGDGAGVEHQVSHAPGTAENPLSDAQLAEKFRRLTEPLVGRQRADVILGSLRRLEHLQDVSSLARQLSR
jgi:2-methylcitrate dehydratase PrpD